MYAVNAVVATILSALGIQRLVLPLIAQSASILYPTSEVVIVVASSIFFVQASEYLWKHGRKSSDNQPGIASPIQWPSPTPAITNSLGDIEGDIGAISQSASPPRVTMADLEQLRGDFESLKNALENQQQKQVRARMKVNGNGAKQPSSPPQQALSPPPINNGAKNGNGKKNIVDVLLGGVS